MRRITRPEPLYTELLATFAAILLIGAIGASAILWGVLHCCGVYS